MQKWIPCGESFIVGDVIRWREPVWKEKRSPRSRSVTIGERVITAEVLRSETDGWVELSTRHCETTRKKNWWKAMPLNLKAGELLSRRRGPIEKDGAERYRWGGTEGESVRGQLTSKLTKAGLAVFEIVYNQVRERHGTDVVMLSVAETTLPRTTYFRGLRELLDNQFLYKSTYDSKYFVNIRFMFNGDRLAFVKGYKLKDEAQQQPALPGL